MRAQDYPKAKKYTDFRKMIEKEKLDAVSVATPDHMHAYISVWAMKHGLHVYCQKPLCKTVHEARIMTKVAAETKVVTQMGTQTSAAPNNMRTVELIQSGALGEIVECHLPSGSPIWPQGYDRPAGEDPVPPTLNWDMWLGVAPVRPYLAMYPKGHPVYGPPPEKAAQSNYKAAGLDPVPPVGVVYHPLVWRGWKDFGTGKLGDQAGHAWNVIVWALGLGPIASAEVLEVSGMTKEQYPDSSIIRFDWAQRGIHPPFKLFWYDGTKRPAKEITGEGGRGGLTWIGTKGSLPPGRGPFLGQKTEPYPTPLQREWGRHEVHLDWCNAIKTGKQAPCDFGYAGPYAESHLLGDIALRVGQRIEWDPVAFRITNSREANQLLRREYRKGWDIREIAGSAFNV
jgi:predicted dehydrogenase